MPTVPKFERQVKTRPVSQARLGGQASFSAPKAIIPDTTGLAKGLQSAAFDIALDAKNKADDAAIMEASNKLDIWEDDALFKTGTGALNTKGKNAFDITSKTAEEYKKFTGETRLGLNNDRQRLAFDKLSSVRGSSMNKTLQRHQRAEMDSFQTQQFDAGIQLSKNRAFLYHNDPEQIGNSVARLQRIISAEGNKRGAPKETIANSLMVQTSDLYKGVLLASIASNNPTDTLKAKGLFDDLKKSGALLPKDALDLDGKFEKVLPEAVARTEFQDLKGNETRSDLEGIAKEVNGTQDGAGKDFISMVEARDRNDFYNQLDKADGPQAALYDLENGKYPGLTGPARTKMKKDAQDRFLKQQQDAKIARMATKSITEGELQERSIGGKLTFAEVDNYQSINKDDPAAVDYAEMLKRNLSSPQKLKGIAAGVIAKTKEKKLKAVQQKTQATETYLNLWERYRDFEVLVKTDKKGKSVTSGGSEASITQLLEFQRDVVAATGTHLTPAQSANFQKMIPILRKKINSAVTPGFWESFGDVMGDDIYAEGYDMAVQFFQNNPSFDNNEARKDLFGDIFTVADMIEAEDIEDPEVKAQKLSQVGNKVVNRFVKAQFPEFNGLSDDEMPSTIFKADGTSLNLPAGSAKAKPSAKVTQPQPLRDSYAAKGGRVITLEDIQDTAKETSNTPQEVVRQLRARGIIE